MYFPNSSQFPIQHLEESFFSGMRSTVNVKTLKKLAEFAKTIPEPELFGSYQNDLHYMQTLDLMLQSTDETRRRGLFIRKIIFPLLENHTTLLDIGPGNGLLTSWIGNNFNYISVVDINKEAIESLNVKKRILHSHIYLEKIHSSIFDSNLRKNYYDLSLLSHVLYYIDRSLWIDVVKLAYQATSCNGLLVIVLSGEESGKARLIKKIWW